MTSTGNPVHATVKHGVKCPYFQHTKTAVLKLLERGRGPWSPFSVKASTPDFMGQFSPQEKTIT